MLGEIFELSITTLPISGDMVVQNFFTSLPQLEMMCELPSRGNGTYIFRRFKVKRSNTPIHIIDDKHKGGRPSVLTESDKKTIIEKKRNGASINGLAKQYGVARSCIYNLIADDKEEATPQKLEISITTNSATSDEDVADFFKLCPQLEYIKDIKKNDGYNNGKTYRQIEAQFKPDFHFRTGKGGRPHKLPPEKEAELMSRLTDENCNKSQLAKEYGISRTKVINVGKNISSK